jgi:predicted enzyme related to lactoylglutathione lyase
MDMDVYEHGVPSWADLQTPELEAAKTFYAAFFGWDVPDGPAEAGGYTMGMVRGRPVAGLGPQMNPGPAAWATYVNVDDADDIAAKVTANGGTNLMGPMDVMDVGRLLVFADPTGAVCGAWQPRAHRGAGIVNEPNTMCWNALVSTDTGAAKTFYKAVFGWDAQDQGDPVAYTEWKLGERSVGGLLAKPAEMPAAVPSHWGVYFAVEDTDAMIERAKGLGASVIVPPMDVEPGRFAGLMDPTGAAFYVITLKEQ